MLVGGYSERCCFGRRTGGKSFIGSVPFSDSLGAHSHAHTDTVLSRAYIALTKSIPFPPHYPLLLTPRPPPRPSRCASTLSRARRARHPRRRLGPGTRAQLQPCLRRRPLRPRSLHTVAHAASAQDPTGGMQSALAAGRGGWAGVRAGVQGPDGPASARVRISWPCLHLIDGDGNVRCSGARGACWTALQRR